MAGSYDIKFADVQSVQNDYAQFRNAFDSAVESLVGAIERVSCLDSFKGEAATSVKEYFNAVHMISLDSLRGLVGQLDTDLNVGYAEGFWNDPVSAQHDAQLPETGLKDAESDLQILMNGLLCEAESFMEHAQSALPCAINATCPHTWDIQEIMGAENTRISKKREAAREVEDRGYQLFSDGGGEYGQLEQSFFLFLGQCGSAGAISISNYNSAAFSQTLESTGLRAAYADSMTNQQENSEALISAKKDTIERQEVIVKEREAKALEKKKFWCSVGTVLGVVAFAAGAVAFVATAGAAGPIVLALKTAAAAISLGNTIGDTAQRVQQLYYVETGKDIYADKDENEIISGSIKIGKTAISGAATIESIKYHANTDFDKVLTEDTTSFLTNIAGEVVDETSDYITDKLRKQGYETAGVYVDGAGEIASEAVEQAFKGEFDGVGLAGAAAKGGQAVADHYTAEADEELEACRDEKEELDNRNTDVNLGSYSSAW